MLTPSQIKTSLKTIQIYSVDCLAQYMWSKGLYDY